MSHASHPWVTETLVSFLQGGVSISVAARGPDNLASMSRACGCRFSRDRRKLTIFLSRIQAAELLRDVAADGRIAVVISDPATHRSWQFKGTDASVAALGRGDASRLQAYVESFVRSTESLGYSPALIRALFSNPPGAGEPEHWAAVTFTPTCAFSQTPGIAAGNPLEGNP